MTHDFEMFLENFMPPVIAKNKQCRRIFWILETTGSLDAVELMADLEVELSLLFHNNELYEKLLKWSKDTSLNDSLLLRQLNILIRAFKKNMVSESLLTQIAQKEAAIGYSYNNFRPNIDGKPVTDNDIRDILKHETNPVMRLKAWEASKSIGDMLAPQILSLVKLRNEAATDLGYSDYFQMQLDFQEVDSKWLLTTLENLAAGSDTAYKEMIQAIEKIQCDRFGVTVDQLGPWAWNDPFGQEDTVDTAELDALVADVDIVEASVRFYHRMGIDVSPILKNSDMFEREGKNQQAFCVNMDRGSDVRTLNNVRPRIKWLETVLHELGHAIYELGFAPQLPWLLREPPHMKTTEAMALIAGRQAFSPTTLNWLIPNAKQHQKTIEKASASLKRRQLIFSRWVLVMTYFESELYRNPEQDLNALWWDLVAKYQKIRVPANREGKNDWATKYHLALAPVYYFSYLLGEMFASAIEDQLTMLTGSRDIASEPAGQFLNEKLFSPGNSMRWDELVKNVTGNKLSADAWLAQFTI